MRAILIDPENKTITEVSYDGDYKTIYKLIGADLFDCVRLDDSETIFVDDEGLLNGKARNMFRVAGDYPAYLAGKGLLLGTDSEGESIGTNMTVDAVRAIVSFGEMVRHPAGGVVFAAEDGHLYRPD